MDYLPIRAELWKMARYFTSQGISCTAFASTARRWIDEYEKTGGKPCATCKWFEVYDKEYGCGRCQNSESEQYEDLVDVVFTCDKWSNK